jgi:cbb3-type cytochrome oxidase cytochrome c subunit
LPKCLQLKGSNATLRPLAGLFGRRSRELAGMGLALLIALVIYRLQPSAPVAASPSAIERGRLVYISEGCIHCHSQYVRPGTADVLMWGPVENLDEIHPQRAALIGDHVKGPDLAQVGARRSALWLKMQLFDPGRVSGGSAMPSFAFLFRDQRGNDLVAYLASLRGPGTETRVTEEQHWHLPVDAVASSNSADGLPLYNRYCATCHNPDGVTRLRWQSEFLETPAILNAGMFHSGTAGVAEPAQLDHLAQIIKFGIPDSDMAGHEYLSDRDIASLSKWLAQAPAQPPQKETRTKN